jgi:hypothetical protein
MSDKTAEVGLSHDGETARIVFPADFRISCAKAFMTTVVRAMRKKPGTLVLDAGALERVDAGALQTTVVAWRAMNHAGIAVRWENCPAGLVGSARLLGLASATGIDV